VGVVEGMKKRNGMWGWLHSESLSVLRSGRGLFVWKGGFAVKNWVDMHVRIDVDAGDLSVVICRKGGKAGEC
jgi:hypothetical protein